MDVWVYGWVDGWVDVCMCMYVCMYVYIYMYVCMYVRTYVCMYLCIYVSIYVCVCMYVCMYVDNSKWTGGRQDTQQRQLKLKCLQFVLLISFWLSDQIQLLSCSSLSSSCETAQQRWAQASCLGIFARGRHRRWYINNQMQSCQGGPHLFDQDGSLMVHHIQPYLHMQSCSDYSGKEILFDRVYGLHSRTEKESVCISAEFR